MKVISTAKTVLDAEVYVDTIDGYEGLVMESRGGKLGSPGQRNGDYFDALDCIIRRLVEAHVDKLWVFVVSADAIRAWTMEERRLSFDGKEFLTLQGDSTELRKAICKGQAQKKVKRSAKGGNPHKRILLHAELGKASWPEIASGSIDNFA